MKMKKRTLNVMIASPGDVAMERQIVRDVIKNINYWAIFANIEFVSIDWENNTYPTIAEYPQDAINKQLNNKFEILIGIFWSRIGTSTPHYFSGSVEEIELAIKKSKEENNVNVMLYFKTEKIQSDMYDSEQINKLKTFKSSLGERGIYFWEFKSPLDFRNFISQHLALLVQHKYWNESKDKNVVDLNIQSQTEIYKSPIESFDNAIKYRKEIHEIMSYLVLFHEKETKEQGIENNKLNKLLELSTTKGVFSKIKTVIDESTVRIREQSLILNRELSDINECFIKMFNAYSSSILMSQEFSKAEKKKLLNSILSLIDLRDSYSKITNGLDTSIKIHKEELKNSKFPAYNRALKEYLKIKLEYKRIFNDSIHLMTELEKASIKII